MTQAQETLNSSYIFIFIIIIQCKRVKKWKNGLENNEMLLELDTV